jgi:RNA polymerase sigma factor (sigma-70 family)
MRNGADHTTDTALCLDCRHIVRDLIRKYGWALLSEDELVELVLGSVESGIPPPEVARLAKHHYAIATYEACRQDEDHGRREQGYYELSRCLFWAAYNWWPELAEDATQRALLLVYEQIERCQSPGTFLAFALNKLRHAFKQEQRARGKEETDPEPGPNSAEQEGAEAWTYLEDQERCQMLLEAIQRLPNDLMRKAVLLKYFGGLSDTEIGELLGITANYVRVLRHRGIRLMQEDERLTEYLYGTNNEEGGDREASCNI